MARPSKKAIVRAVIGRYPKSFAEELRIDLSRNTPSPLYQHLILSLLCSARISSEIALRAAKALFKEGWRTPQKMTQVTWEKRVKVLNRAGYARYDESTSRYIADTTMLLLDRYDGDLRKLREAAQRQPDEERRLLKQFKGIGEVGADIFFRDVQAVWEEHYPFADKRALKAAEKLGLGGDVTTLARLIAQKELPRLLAGLVRVDLEKETEEILQEAV